MSNCAVMVKNDDKHNHPTLGSLEIGDTFFFPDEPTLYMKVEDTCGDQQVLLIETGVYTTENIDGLELSGRELVIPVATKIVKA